MKFAERVFAAASLALLATTWSFVVAEASSKPVTARPVTQSPARPVTQAARHAPLIFQVTPAKVNPSRQPNIMILGQNLTPTTQVLVGGLPAVTMDASDGYHLLAKLPLDLQGGSYLIKVTNEAGSTTADNRLQVDTSDPGLNRTTLFVGGAVLALLLLVMRLARTPGMRNA